VGGFAGGADEGTFVVGEIGGGDGDGDGDGVFVAGEIGAGDETSVAILPEACGICFNMRRNCAFDAPAEIVSFAFHSSSEGIGHLAARLSLRGRIQLVSRAGLGGKHIRRFQRGDVSRWSLKRTWTGR
jgi:hypothetical protein